MITSPQTIPPQTPLTIYVHGTQRGILNWVPPQMTWAYQFTHLPNGLHRVLDISHDYIYSHVLKHIASGNTKMFPLEHCYIFCWTGILSHEARVKAAIHLNQCLNTLLKNYSKEQVFLRLITHSHGGNVVLNIMNITNKKEYLIDQLILMASPVQKTTLHCAEDATIIKEIISLHSHGDLIQIGAPQQHPQEPLTFDSSFFKDPEKIKDFLFSLLPSFSQRHFPKGSRVKEISITCNKKSIGHLRFMLPSCTTQLGNILDSAKKHDFSKGEMEYNIPEALKSDFLQFLQ